MLKIVFQKQGDDKKTIVLGLSLENIARLKQNDPAIVFGRDLGLRPDEYFVIGWKTPDGQLAMPNPDTMKAKGFPKCVAISFNQCAEGKEETIFSLKHEGLPYHFDLCWAESQDRLNEIFRELANEFPDTPAIQEGFDPSTPGPFEQN